MGSLSFCTRAGPHGTSEAPPRPLRDVRAQTPFLSAWRPPAAAFLPCEGLTLYHHPWSRRKRSKHSGSLRLRLRAPRGHRRRTKRSGLRAAHRQRRLPRAHRGTARVQTGSGSCRWSTRSAGRSATAAGERGAGTARELRRPLLVRRTPIVSAKARSFLARAMIMYADFLQDLLFELFFFFETRFSCVTEPRLSWNSLCRLGWP